MTDENQVGTPAPDETNVPVAETPEGSPAPEQTAESSPAATQDSEVAEVKGIQRRFDELTRLRREAERNAEHWREMAMRSQPAPEPDATPKTLADFQYDEAKYQQYLFSTAETLAIAAAKRELQQQVQQENQTRRTQSFTKLENDFAKKQADYFEVTRSDDLRISSAMAEAIAESEEGPALAYHLGKNPEIAEQIARRSPYAAARELGRIEERLRTEREKAKAPVVSKAPPPAPKLGATDGSVPVSPDDPSSDSAMSDAEWMRRRDKQMKKKHV